MSVRAISAVALQYLPLLLPADSEIKIQEYVLSQHGMFANTKLFLMAMIDVNFYNELASWLLFSAVL